MNALSALFKQGFAHGVHPAENKERTQELPIQRMPFVDRYVIPLHQNLGAPAKAMVVPGQRVQRGECIAEPGAFVSTALHSPVTGWVRSIGPQRFVDGRFAQAIEITADPYSTQRLAPKPPIDWAALSMDAFIGEIQQAGIVGLGGAAFPAHVKLSLPEGQRIRHLLINGAECEPFLTNDHRLMLERPETLIRGIEIMRQKLGAEEATIGVELNKRDAIEVLQQHLRGDLPIRVVPLRVKYPQGAEKMLIKSIYNKEVPSGLLPRDLEILVNNVGTVVAIADYFDLGMPLIERVVTVSGPGVAYPANLIVPLGTPVREVLRFCGGLKEETREVLMGGPMMGAPIASLDAPMLKGSSGLLAFTAQETARPKETPCIRCGRCVEACPYFLNPSRLARLAKARLFDEMKAYQVMECVECGSCTFSCPSGIPIVQLIRTAKDNLRQGKRRAD
ncbi:electron transport complex subunit RsxC [Thiorhodococcus mannitoliphagus]|uniref:Ion-translocating oxidoreductase complex subunit C n=1 Tax=Thiorhodococcus mannitoliphagus TaxID=329406 RepID=A0A6P1E1N6_9GAMM|nr:electron transport complex subunit RsxC [Thiorhodococcus mannitoliphagus]NEX21635.1 electron transport complex subunit RsxC [Thiorhodococcus mannitoliphagus]